MSARWRRWLADDRFFVRKEVRRLRLRWKIGLTFAALICLWASASAWLPAVADPLVARPRGLATQAILAETWFALDRQTASVIAEIHRGRPVYLVMNAEEEDDYGFDLDRPGQSRANLARAGVDTSRVTFLLMPKRADIPGYTAYYAAQTRERLLSDGIRSFTLVTESFHSERSFLIYSRAFEGSGVLVDCHPTPLKFGRTDWWRTSSGMRYVMAEYIKLGYYFFRGFR